MQAVFALITCWPSSIQYIYQTMKARIGPKSQAWH